MEPYQKLSRGEPYPLALGTTEGACALFLQRDGNTLQIVLPDMCADEERALRSGTLLAGLLIDGSALLWLFRFLGRDLQPLLTLDAPFDARRIPADLRALPDLDAPNQRLLLQVHGIDERRTLRALRGVSLPAGLTRTFLCAAMDQLGSAASGDAAHARWARFEPVELVKLTTLEVCGR